MQTSVYINQIASAVPPYDVHQKFLDYMPRLLKTERERKLFERLAHKSQIEHRYSVLPPSDLPEHLDNCDFYIPDRFPSTAKRMKKYEAEALQLAREPVARVLRKTDPHCVTHLLVTSCTGFYAPGLDLDIQRNFGLSTELERSIIGFMGCFAAFNALKAAYHIVRSQPRAKVLIVNLELCSLHLNSDSSLEQQLAFMQFADGCAASLVSSEPFGLELHRFRCDVWPEAVDLIQWHIGDSGFDMYLSPQVPQALGHNLPAFSEKILLGEPPQLWAIHPGGRAILDVVQEKLQIPDSGMQASRAVLRNFGNMSSATIMFVFEKILHDVSASGEGLALAFGPGLSVESLRFQKQEQ